ncbi:ysgA [Symbiodinium pilosum]|uniref:YsgA protein n=1 Tax=Symbiodinium pilosum TaxID=2952 RepID=A0A812KKP4_SYMPI|nr:ysgA [Symbiodinium pilosum]
MSPEMQQLFTMQQHVLFGPKAPLKSLDDDDLVIGQISQPQATEEFHSSTRCLLAVDKIKHPENMGLLLSSAVALKFDGIVFSAECADPFCYKVLEASQAVAWTLPYRYATAQQLVELCERHELLLCAAHTDGKPASEVMQNLSGQRGFCLVVGNEADGVHAGLLRSCMQVALPMSELMESLNAGVAGGILMHALTCAWMQHW